MIADTFLSPFERVGRAVVDIGLGSFFEKFEEHLGKGLTKALLIIIGLAVTAVCVGLIWNTIILPLAKSLPNPKSQSVQYVAELLVFTALFGTLANSILGMVDNYFRRKITRQMRQKLAEAHKITDAAEQRFEEAKQIREEAMQLHQESGDALAASNLLMEEMFSNALEKGLVTQEQVDELRALRMRPIIPTPGE